MGKFIVRRQGGRHARAKMRRIHVRIEIMNSILVVLVAGLGLFYVIKMNRDAAQGYVMRSATNKIEALEADTHELEGVVARLQSLQYVRNSSSQLGLVPVDTVEYLATKTGAVAQR